MSRYRLFQSTYTSGDLYPACAVTTTGSTWRDIFDDFIREHPRLKESLSDGQLIVLKNEGSETSGLAVMRVTKGSLGIEPVQ